MMTSEEPNVGNFPVRRNDKYMSILSPLFNDKTEFGMSIFPFGKDLMIFAAMVGLSANKREPVDKESTQIFLSVYSSDEKDGFIYMLGLLEEKDEKCLKSENLRGTIKHFEEYCNGGLSIISSWVSDKATPDQMADIIYEKIEEQVMPSVVTEDAPISEVSF